MSSVARGLLAFLLILAWGGAAQAAPANLREDTRWQGEVVLEGPLQVDQGVRLTIAAGSTVRVTHPADKLTVIGTLVVEGSAERPVTFATPPGWEGVEFIEAPAGSAIRHARFSGAQYAVSMIAASPLIQNCEFRDGKVGLRLLREAAPKIVDNRFAGNEVGIDNEMRSAPLIRGNRFEGQTVSAIVASNNARGAIEDNHFERNAQGIGIVQPYPDPIRANRFIANGTALYCSQSKNTPLIADNLFEKNDKGVVNFSFAYPAVEGNRFLDNREAIRNDQFGSALVRRNLIRGSETAIYLNRKSNARIEENRIEKNGLALFVDYSSYPTVRGNHFADNAMAVKLGIYQSADWEKRAGSKRLVQKEAAARQSQNPLLAQAPESFNDYVDVSGNWWGELTPRLRKAGGDANLPFFHDRRDQPSVVYPGFGDGRYALDVIRYAPWLEAPPASAGPGGR